MGANFVNCLFLIIFFFFTWVDVCLSLLQTQSHRSGETAGDIHKTVSAAATVSSSSSSLYSSSRHLNSLFLFLITLDSVWTVILGKTSVSVEVAYFYNRRIPTCMLNKICFCFFIKLRFCTLNTKKQKKNLWSWVKA